MSKWVQHRSGDGEKWKVTEDGRNCNKDMNHPCWVVQSGDGYFYLPKSEYRECEGPEVWVDVTEKCEFTYDQYGTFKSYCLSVNGKREKCDGSNYRLRKVEIHKHCDMPSRLAFVVEKRQ